MDGVKGPVCVTGGTGFIGSWLTMRLLDHGYSVRTTVRPASSEQKKDVSFLTSLPGASERLQIFNADLSDPQSFNAPIEGCTGVFHVATPIDFEDKEPEEIVTKIAVDWEVDEMDESFWSDVDFLKASKPAGHPGSYIISKTSTERASLEFAEKHGLDVVTLIPSFVVGPFICPKFPFSVRMMLAMVLGDKDQYSFLLNASLVHVDDLARAHIFLFECPTVKGRYICSSDIVTIEQMSQFLSARYPEFQIPTLDSLKEIRGYKIPSLSTKKLLDSGFKYKYGINEMFDGAIQCCKEKGYL
ncbi:hypothetical protein FH972_001726 [Carpinus fangiana]|uniref:NAD-dependent epimerase/dehydratase domain-containing protein n=1 Tax=Carpinus fangiana TaxID=176857 RepID=A0A5N6QEG5_9ROSI|nr:hypothetical protein FH972_001726 [Carpinus fangiana]